MRATDLTHVSQIDAEHAVQCGPDIEGGVLTCLALTRGLASFRPVLLLWCSMH